MPKRTEPTPAELVVAAQARIPVAHRRVALDAVSRTPTRSYVANRAGLGERYMTLSTKVPEQTAEGLAAIATSMSLTVSEVTRRFLSDGITHYYEQQEPTE